MFVDLPKRGSHAYAVTSKNLAGRSSYPEFKDEPDHRIEASIVVDDQVSDTLQVPARLVALNADEGFAASRRLSCLDIEVGHASLAALAFGVHCPSKFLGQI